MSQGLADHVPNMVDAVLWRGHGTGSLEFVGDVAAGSKRNSEV